MLALAGSGWNIGCAVGQANKLHSQILAGSRVTKRHSVCPNLHARHLTTPLSRRPPPLAAVSSCTPVTCRDAAVQRGQKAALSASTAAL